MNLVQSIALYPASGLALTEVVPLSTLDIPDQELPADLLPPSPPSDFFEISLRQGIVSNAVLAQFLTEEKGDRARAAKKAGLAESTVTRRVEAAKKGNPLFPHKRTRIYCRVDDLTLAAALARHKGNRRQAAKEVGLSPSSVAERVIKAEANSPLFSDYKKQKGVGRHPLKVSNEALDLGMREHGGNAAIVAEIHGVSSHGLNTRIRNAPPDDPHLAHLKVRTVKKRAPRRKTSGSSVKRNHFLFVLQLQAAPDASPVARVARDRIPDSRMAEVLAHHLSDSAGAARELGVIPEVVAKRLEILRSKPEWSKQSPLARFV